MHVSLSQEGYLQPPPVHRFNYLLFALSPCAERVPLCLQGKDRRLRQAALTLFYAEEESWEEQINFCSGTLASILGPGFLSETGISLLDPRRLISIKDQCSVAGLCVLLVTLLCPNNRQQKTLL